MKIFVVLCIAALAVDARLIRRRSAQAEYKMCVPQDLMSSCEEMIKQETKSVAKIVCIPARDRIECIDKIKERQADFGTVDPEDMYVAGNVPNNDFQIFEEIRSREEPEAEFRYEGVALIHKDLEIDSVQGLKGLKSCHTGVGRNVGYKIPLTKLKNMGIIGKLNEPNMSPRENELDAFSKLFSKACIVGKWSPDPIINDKLKKRYSNLCEMCEDPAKCDYPDKYSGYDGAIRCLVHNGGQVAWTKVIYVRKFFGLPVGVTLGHPTSEHAEDYAYFCPDGSRVPITSTPCRWAARPWQGYMANAAVVKNIDELRKKIENLNTEGQKTNAQWLEKVLEISEKNVAKENKMISPKDYLDKANYTDVIEREYGPPYKTVRLCVTSNDELEKCRAFSKAAFTRNIRPRFDCVQEDDCMKTIRDNGADVITLPTDKIKKAIEEFNLKPIVAEKNKEGSNFAIAVVKKDSKYKSFAELKGAKSCHVGNKIAGFYAPMGILKKLGLLQKPAECSAEQAVVDYFGGGCLSKADKAYTLSVESVAKMCDSCTGKEKCTGCPIKCLMGGGDVAFMMSGDIEKIDEAKRGEYELLCPDGGRAALTEYKTCQLLQSEVPPNMMVTSNSKSDEDIEEYQNALLSASETYSKRPDWFKMFGTFNGKKNLLFSNAAIGLESVKDFQPTDLTKIMSPANDFCK